MSDYKKHADRISGPFNVLLITGDTDPVVICNASNEEKLDLKGEKSDLSKEIIEPNEKIKMKGMKIAIDLGASKKASKTQKKRESRPLWNCCWMQFPSDTEMTLFAFVVLMFMVTLLASVLLFCNSMSWACREDYDIAIHRTDGDYIWDDKAQKQVSIWNMSRLSSEMCAEKANKLNQDYKPQIFYPTLDEDYKHFEAESGYAKDRVAKGEYDMITPSDRTPNPNRILAIIIDSWVPTVKHIAVIDYKHYLKIEWTTQISNISDPYCVVLINEDRTQFGHQITADNEIKIRLPHNYFYYAQVKITHNQHIVHSKQFLISTKPTREAKDRYFIAFSKFAIFNWDDRVVKVFYMNMKYVLLLNFISAFMITGILAIRGFRQFESGLGGYFNFSRSR